MYILLEGKNEIKKAQRKLNSIFEAEFKHSRTKNIGFPSGKLLNKVVRTNGTHYYRSSEYSGSEVTTPRWINSFGSYNKDGDLSITVEINVVLKGRGKTTAGFFARNTENNKIYLFHNGGIGGGMKGVSKEHFLAWSDLELERAECTDGSFRHGVLIMPVDQSGSASQAVHYMKIVANFKQAVRSGEMGTKAFKEKLDKYYEYYDEPSGRRKGKRSKHIDYISRHGEIVRGVMNWREKQPLPNGGRIVKNKFIDLGVSVDEQLVELYEIKTSSSLTNVYSAIGQLFVHGIEDNCFRAVVLPKDEPLRPILTSTLQRLNIALILFSINGETVTITS